MMANKNNAVLYTGVTNCITSRVRQHKKGTIDGFTKKYKCTKLVFAESTSDILAAIEREKEIKGWKREKKNKLVETINPNWMDLSSEL